MKLSHVYLTNCSEVVVEVDIMVVIVTSLVTHSIVMAATLCLYKPYYYEFVSIDLCCLRSVPHKP